MHSSTDSTHSPMGSRVRTTAILVSTRATRSSLGRTEETEGELTRVARTSSRVMPSAAAAAPEANATLDLWGHAKWHRVTNQELPTLDPTPLQEAQSIRS